jgi:xanthine dehydrogenase accessory factor
MSSLASLGVVGDQWLRDARRVACALLVETEGSAPIAPGATMFIGEHGSIEGSLTGGCVESAVVGEAEETLAGGAPRTVTYGISDELAGTVGLTCGGTVHVFVHELTEAGAAAELAVLCEVAAGRPVAIATLLDGPTAGAKLLLVDGHVSGSLGVSPPRNARASVSRLREAADGTV